MARSQPPGRHAPAARTLLLRGPGCAARGRRFVDRMLAGKVDHDTISRVNLVVSELVTNAYQHGDGAIELQLAHRDRQVRVEVTDEGRGAAPEIRENAGEEGGWGLLVVDMMSTAWGVFEGTTHVWAELAAEPA